MTEQTKLIIKVILALIDGIVSILVSHKSTLSNTTSEGENDCALAIEGALSALYVASQRIEEWCTSLQAERDRQKRRGTLKNVKETKSDSRQ